jgi:hypothetical protein
MSANERDFSYLWDGSEDGWVLVRGASEEYGIVNNPGGFFGRAPK